MSGQTNTSALSRFMKGRMWLTILETIGNAAVNAHDLSIAILTAGYGASQGKIKQAMRQAKRERSEQEFSREERVRYYKLLSALRRDGLIAERHSAGRKFLELTKKGIARLTALRKRSERALPPQHYEAESSERFTIVAFDIPESERRKRNWLRNTLRHLRLHMIQKSVWMGKVRLPKQFFDDLAKLHLVNYVEVFEITRTGTLRHLA